MAKTNGNGFKRYITLVVFCAGSIIGGFKYIGDNVIANDKASRSRDTAITKEIVAVQKETTNKLTEILIAIAKLQTKIEEGD